MAKVDVVVQDNGSTVFLRPQSRQAISWINRNIGKDNGYQPYWPTVLIEPRYVEAVVDGMEADGLLVVEGR